MIHRPRLTLGSVLWILCVQYFVAEQIARAGWTIPYSASANFISDLGALRCDDAICSPLHAVMNGSFVLQGVLMFAGALFLRLRFPTDRLLTAGFVLIMLSGIGVALVGAFPEDVIPRVHYLAAGEHFLSADLGMILLGAAFVRRSYPSRGLGVFSIASGSVALVALLLLVGERFCGLGVGGMERAAAYPLPIWLTAMGVASSFASLDK